MISLGTLSKASHFHITGTLLSTKDNANFTVTISYRKSAQKRALVYYERHCICIASNYLVIRRKTPEFVDACQLVTDRNDRRRIFEETFEKDQIQNAHYLRSITLTGHTFVYDTMQSLSAQSEKQVERRNTESLERVLEREHLCMENHVQSQLQSSLETLHVATKTIEGAQFLKQEEFKLLKGTSSELVGSLVSLEDIALELQDLENIVMAFKLEMESVLEDMFSPCLQPAYLPRWDNAKAAYVTALTFLQQGATQLGIQKHTILINTKRNEMEAVVQDEHLNLELQLFHYKKNALQRRSLEIEHRKIVANAALLVWKTLRTLLLHNVWKREYKAESFAGEDGIVSIHNCAELAVVYPSGAGSASNASRAIVRALQFHVDQKLKPTCPKVYNGKVKLLLSEDCMTMEGVPVALVFTSNAFFGSDVCRTLGTCGHEYDIFKI